MPTTKTNPNLEAGLAILRHLPGCPSDPSRAEYYTQPIPINQGGGTAHQVRCMDCGESVVSARPFAEEQA